MSAAMRALLAIVIGLAENHPAAVMARTSSASVPTSAMFDRIARVSVACLRDASELGEKR